MAQNVNLNIDPKTLIECGTKMVQEAAAFNKEVERIYGTTLVNLKNAWTGESATQFINAIEKFEGDYRNFGKLINQLGELILAVGKDYENFEKGTY